LTNIGDLILPAGVVTHAIQIELRRNGPRAREGQNRKQQTGGRHGLGKQAPRGMRRHGGQAERKVIVPELHRAII